MWLSNTLVFEENDTESSKVLNENHSKCHFKILIVLPLSYKV